MYVCLHVRGRWNVLARFLAKVRPLPCCVPLVRSCVLACCISHPSSIQRNPTHSCWVFPSPTRIRDRRACNVVDTDVCALLSLAFDQDFNWKASLFFFGRGLTQHMRTVVWHPEIFGTASMLALRRLLLRSIEDTAARWTDVPLIFAHHAQQVRQHCQRDEQQQGGP